MFRTGHLPVSDGHQIYYEYHRDTGHPVFLYLHGGPGGGIRDDERGLLLGQAPNAVLFDQRGAGRCRCQDMLAGNTTAHLIADIEALRAHLGIERWHLFGGSWGSTLALAYAVAYPNRVAGMILWGIFLCRQAELAWFYDGGAAHLYPGEYDRFRRAAAANAGESLLVAYHRRVNDPDRRRAVAAARSWGRWEAVNSFLVPTEQQIAGFTRPDQALPMARLETHYFVNGRFLGDDDRLLAGAETLADVPTILVQGRYDTICPPTTAWALDRALPRSDLRIVLDAAHDSSEPGIRKALAEAIQSFSNG